MKNEANKARKDLGARIRELRKTSGITQEYLGEKAELSYKFIGELERGQVNVSLDSLVRIAEALGVKPGDLFFREKLPVQRILIKEESQLSKLSSNDITLIKKSLRLLNRAFAKI